jgi:hypothetical protein
MNQGLLASFSVHDDCVVATWKHGMIFIEVLQMVGDSDLFATDAKVKTKYIGIACGSITLRPNTCL